MSNLLIGLLCGLVAGIPFDFGREGWVKKWLILTVSWTVISTFIIWLVLPGFVGPLWGGKIWLLLFLGLVFNLVYSASGESDTYGVQCKSFHPWRVVTFMLSFCLIPLVVGLQSCAAFHHEDYRAFVAQDMEKREWKSDMNPVNTAHIRMVSEEQAIWLAQKALGQSSDMGLGSRFRIIEITIQKVKDRLVWVAPLEFQDFRAWEASGTSPGYVTVDAEDPNKPAELHDGFSLRYMQNAYYEFYLERHVYEHGYRFKGTTDYTFEIDDEGKPFMVVTVYEPTIGYKGEQVTEVLVVDPQTGDMVSYAPKLAPEWIDRIIPSTFAKERLVDYGEFVHGWKNSWWGEKDVNVPTVVRHNGKKPAGCDVRCQNVADTLSLTWGDDGQAYWFAGLTSSKSTDDSLVGFVLMDSRTGHTREYQLPGGSDAIGVMEAVNSTVSNYDGWHATQPILYNIYGALTWAVPVISSENIFQRLALVRASNSKVVLGTDKESALFAYRQMLSRDGVNAEDPSAQANLETITGVIDRIACPVVDGNTVCLFNLLEDPSKKIYSGSMHHSIPLMLSHPGDRVTVGYVQTSSPNVPIESFRIAGSQTEVTEPDAGLK